MRVLELRQYTLLPGRRDELIELFDREFVEPQEALGMQIVGRAFDEPTVLRIGAAYEAVAHWTGKRPQLELAMAG